MKYSDGTGKVFTQLVIVGENNAYLLDSKVIGLSQEITPQGNAADWLREGIKEHLASKSESIQEL